jgi:two-component system nitrogen regulation response regulator GlnG
LRLPPLRERREDVPLLAKHFLAKSARELNADEKHLSDVAMSYLTKLDFPGNVRQLENICHWITVMAPGQQVEITDLPPDVRGSDKSGAAIDTNWQGALEREVTALLARGDRNLYDSLGRIFESALIAKALEHTAGKRIEAATLLGIGRNTLTRKIAELNLA